MIDNFIQPVIEEYTQGKYIEEIQEARNEFFSKTGQINEDDQFFESRMALFFDWYIFDRKLNGSQFTPIKDFYRKNKDIFSPENSLYYRGLANHIHSIFNLIKLNTENVQLTDLATRKNYNVNPGPIRLSLSLGDIFEGRIVPFGKEWWFTTGFCFHPKEVKKFILDEIKKARLGNNKTYQELILELAAMKLKFERYQHIGPEKIYARGNLSVKA